ncbi:MAG: hypothetical protein WBA37_07590 [Xanthobacteraceae bacterium]|jgi:hypothetical protein|nr:hypothetical protein [Hyphomicrobiales bacterium]
MIDVQCEQERFLLGYRVSRAVAIGQCRVPRMAARHDVKSCGERDVIACLENLEMHRGRSTVL